MRKMIAAGIAAATVAGLGLVAAAPAQAVAPTGWREVKAAQTVLKQVWREQSNADQQSICDMWIYGDEDTRVDFTVGIMRIMIDKAGTTPKEAARTTVRFFDSACY